MDAILFSVVLAAAGFLATRLALGFSARLRMLDVPGVRSSHFLPTPRGGGLGFVVVILLAGAFLFQPALLAGAAAVACIGWLDDRRSRSAALRFAVHCAAALWALLWLGAPWGLPGGVFFFLAIVWLINSYNFMDGTDGLAAGEAVAVGFLAFCLCESPAGWLCLLTSSTVFGFLYWNWPPAKIFMGDVGSGFLGCVFGTAWLVEAQGNPDGFFTLPILLGCFLVDSTLTLLWRVFRGEKWYAAHRLHVYQTYSARYGHRAVMLVCTGITIFWLAPFAWLAREWPAWGIVFAGAASLPLLGFVTYVHAAKTAFPQ